MSVGISSKMKWFKQDSCCKQIFFAAYRFCSVFFFLFISSNIAMKYLLCLCMVSYTVDMHIGSLVVEMCLLTLKGERSQSLGLVTCQIKDTIVWNIVTTNFIFRLTLTKWGQGQTLKCQKLPLYGIIH